MTGAADTASPNARLRIGVLEPHLRRFGGIRRILELTNRMVEPGP